MAIATFLPFFLPFLALSRTVSRMKTIIHPAKSGIRIREVTNSTNGEQFGTSYMVTVPSRITGGKRVRKQIARLDDAKEWAADQFHTGRKMGAAFHKLTEYEQKLCVDALEMLRPKGISIFKAAQFALERMAPEICTKLAKEVVDELIASRKAAGASKRYLSDLHSRLTRFAEKFNCPLSHVTAKQIADWIASLELSPQSQINFRRVIVTLFQFAIEQGYVPRTFDEHERVRVAKVRGGDVEVYSPEEVARLLAAAPLEFLPCLAIAAFAGLRSAEVERLTWEEVRLAEQIIELKSGKSKTRARRIIPISDNLAAWLAPYAKETGLLWKGTHRDFYSAQQQTAEATKTKAKPALAWKQNGLRHSFCSYRLATTGDAAKVSLEAGNSAAMIFQHYRKVVREEDAKTYFSIAPTPAENVTHIRKVV